MDVNRLSTWEKIAGVAGLALSLSLFVPWWQVDDPGEGEWIYVSGWEGLGFIDILIFAGGLLVAGLVAAKAFARRVSLPVTTGALIAAVGVVCALLTIYRAVEPPAIEDVGGEAGQVAESVEDADSIGVPGLIEISEAPLGPIELESALIYGAILIAGLIAFGGWKLMQSEGTSPGEQFSQLRERLGGGGASGTAGATAPRQAPAATRAPDPYPPPPPPPGAEPPPAAEPPPPPPPPPPAAESPPPSAAEPPPPPPPAAEPPPPPTAPAERPGSAGPAPEAPAPEPAPPPPPPPDPAKRERPPQTGGGAPTDAPPPSAADRVSGYRPKAATEPEEPPRHRRGMTLGIVAAALVVAVGAGAYFLLVRDDESTSPEVSSATTESEATTTESEPAESAATDSEAPDPQAASDAGAAAAASSGDAAEPEEPASDVEEAEAGFVEHWRLINEGDYAAAYELIWDSYATSASDWIADLESYDPKIAVSEIEVSPAGQASDDEIRLEAQVVTRDRGGSDPGRCNLFAGQVRMVKEGDQWLYGPGTDEAVTFAAPERGGTADVLPPSDPRCP